MSDAPLKPCPFCGGAAELWRAHPHPDRAAWIACMGKCSVLVSKEHKTDEEAIAAWNTRTDMCAHAQSRADQESLSAALEVPEVAALVEAAQYMVIQAEWRESKEGIFWEATDMTRAALRTLKGGA